MKDLCIDARMAFFSGIGTYIREIIPHLRAHFRVSLLVDRKWCDGIAFKAPIYSIQEQLQYPFKIPSCDVFWSPHYNVPLFPIRAKKRVTTIHDACHLEFGSLAQRFYARLLMSRALKSDHIITVSQFSKGEIEKTFGDRDINVIPIGVNLERFSPREPCERVRQKYSLPEKFALFVGSRKPHKNLDGLVRAIQKTDLALVTVGKGLTEVDQEDLPVVYSMAEVFVFPSFYEGFGLPPLEAMACGCPTAVSTAASIPDVCGDASIYFDPRNENDMARAIQGCVEQRKELIEKGQMRVKLFSWKRCAERHVEILNA